MGKIVSAVLSGMIGVGLAVGAAYAITTSSTKAPAVNPANTQVVNYGNR